MRARPMSVRVLVLNDPAARAGGALGPHARPGGGLLCVTVCMYMCVLKINIGLYVSVFVYVCVFKS